MSFEHESATVPARAAPLSHTELALVELGRHLRRLGYQFITPTPSTMARVNARPRNHQGTGLAAVFGWNRPFDPAILAPTTLGLMRAAGILQACGSGYRSAVRVSSLGPDLFFHSSYPTSAVDAVFFGPDTYRFVRQLDAALPALRGSITRAVDIGCGAGPGAVAVARLCPGAAVHALDINQAALSLTAVNAHLADTPNLVACHSDMLRGIDGNFDLIVSNPPYLVDADQRAYRHGGGPLGAGLSLAVVDAAIERLAPGGTLLLYTGAAIVDGVDPLRVAASGRLDRAGLVWSYDEIDPDVFGEELDTPAYGLTDRIAAVWLRATRVQNSRSVL